ncbi:MAG: IS1634 family transposase [Rectinema sp.]
MYVQPLFEKKTGRTLLFYYTARRVKGKIVKTKVSRIGYLDEFLDRYPDPLAHFRQEAKRLTLEAQAQKRTISFSLDEHFSFRTGFEKAEDASGEKADLRYAYGVLPLRTLYRELKIDYFLRIKAQYRKADFDYNHIFQLLIFGRILFPASKLATWRDRTRILQHHDFSDDAVYRALPFFAEIKDALLRHLHEQVQQQYQRDTSLLYYDVTNYYWEVDREDELRKRGVSKEHRPEPIVQMGLFMDNSRLPVTYGLFPGNTNDVATMRPMMQRLTESLGNQQLIYVADKGMMSGMNIAQIILEHHGYVISSSVRKADAELKGFILDPHGYTELAGGCFRYKSRLVPCTLYVETPDGKKRRLRINERQVVFWSEEYRKKARYDRAQAITKALAKAGYGENTVLNNHGGNRFLKKGIFDLERGNEVERPAFSVALDEELLESEKELDGYYLIRSNVVGLRDGEASFGRPSRWHAKDNLFELNRPVTDLDIIDMYRGLWQIEESFKITKSELKARPAFVHREDSIEAHFLSCFVALLLLRLLEKRTGERIPVATMIESLRKAQLVQLEDETFVNAYCDNVIEAIGKAFALDLTKKYYSKGDLKALRGKTAKPR